MDDAFILRFDDWMNIFNRHSFDLYQTSAKEKFMKISLQNFGPARIKIVTMYPSITGFINSKIQSSINEKNIKN